jgi:hypothetical protein
MLILYPAGGKWFDHIERPEQKKRQEQYLYIVKRQPQKT